MESNGLRSQDIKSKSKNEWNFFLLKVIQILMIVNIFLIVCYGILYKCFNHHQHKIKCHNSVSSLLHVYHSGCLN